MWRFSLRQLIGVLATAGVVSGMVAHLERRRAVESATVKQLQEHGFRVALETSASPFVPGRYAVRVSGVSYDGSFPETPSDAAYDPFADRAPTPPEEMARLWKQACDSCGVLRDVRVRNADLSYADSNVFAAAPLQRLFLSDCRLPPAGLALPVTLEELRLTRVVPWPPVAGAGLSSLADLPYLKEIHLEAGRDSPPLDLQSLPLLRPLRVLGLKGRAIDQRQAAHLLAHGALEELFLQRCRFSEGALEELSQLNSIKRIHFAPSDDAPEFDRMLRELLKRTSWPSLEILSLSGCKVSAPELRELLQRHPELRHLSVGCIDCDGDELVSLLSGCSLESVSFDEPRLTAEQHQRLREASKLAVGVRIQL